MIEKISQMIRDGCAIQVLHLINNQLKTAKGIFRLELYFKLLEVRLILGHCGDIEEVFKCLKETDILNQPQFLGEYYYRLGIYQLATNQLSEGKKSLEQAFQGARTYQQKKINIQCSRYYAIIGNYSEQYSKLLIIEKQFQQQLFKTGQGDIFDVNLLRENLEQKNQLLVATLAEQFGYYYANTHQMRQSENYHQYSLNIRKAFLSNPNHFLIAISLCNVAFCKRANLDFEGSQDMLNKAKKLFAESDLTAENFHYFGRIAFSEGILELEHGYYEEAIKKLNRSKELRTKFYNDTHRYIAMSLIKMAKAYRKESNIKKSIELLKQALEFLKNIYGTIYHPKIAKVYDAIGYCHFIERDLNEAIAYYLKSLNISQKLIERGEKSEVFSEAQTKCYMGNAYLHIGNYLPKAEKLQRDALKTVDKLIKAEKNPAKYLYNAQAAGYCNLGSICYQKRDFKAALKYYKEVEHIYLKIIKISDKDPRKTKLYNFISEVLVHLKEFDEAKRYLLKAQWVIFKSYSDKLYAKLLNLKKFTAYIQLQFLFNAIKSDKFFRNIEKRAFYDNVMAFVHYYISEENPEKNYPRAFSLMTKYITRVTDNILESCEPITLRRREAEKFKKAYGLGIEIAYQLYQNQGKNKQYIEKAYRLMEFSKNGILSHELLEQEETKEKIDKKQLRDIEQSVRRLYHLEKLMAENNRYTEKGASIREEYEEVKKNHLQYHSVLKTQYPEYYQLKYERKPVHFKKIQQNIAPKSVLVSYFINDDAIYILGIKSNDSFFIKTPKKLTINEVEYDFDKEKEDYLMALYQNDKEDFPAISHRLSQWLYQPMKEHLTDVENLVCIPDETLLNFPFTSLVIEKPLAKEEQTFTYLISQYKLLLHYSVWYFDRNIRAINKNKNKKLLVVSVSNHDHEPMVMGKGKHLEIDRDLQTLVESFQGEVTFLSGAEATKLKFLDIAGEYEYIVLFTHGIKTDDETFLVFAPSKDSQKENSHRLSVGELTQKLNLSNTDLFILCSCHGGNGTPQAGEGIQNALNKAILHIGAKAVIYAVNIVSVKTSLTFLKVFFENFDLLRRRASFQKAILHLSEHARLRNWAVFSIMASFNQRSRQH